MTSHLVGVYSKLSILTAHLLIGSASCVYSIDAAVVFDTVTSESQLITLHYSKDCFILKAPIFYSVEVLKKGQCRFDCFLDAFGCRSATYACGQRWHISGAS